LGFLGRLEHHARAALARFALEGNPVEVAGAMPAPDPAQTVLNAAARRWGWLTTEEARVTLADLGITIAELGERCQEEATAMAVVRAIVAERSPTFEAALRTELYLDGLTLKREVMRLGALRYFAGIAAAHEPSAAELAAARDVVCKHNDELELARLRRRWVALGLGDDRAQDRFILQVARARHAGQQLAARWHRRVEPSVERSTQPAAFAL